MLMQLLKKLHFAYTSKIACICSVYVNSIVEGSIFRNVQLDRVDGFFYFCVSLVIFLV